MSNAKVPIVELKEIFKTYSLGKKKVLALKDINLTVNRGEIIGIIGESGSGKSTLGRIILQLERQCSGSVYFDGRDISRLSQKDMQPLRHKMQMIFQDPFASLNPRMTIEKIIGEGIDIHRLAKGHERRDRIEQLTIEVGLDVDMLKRYPHEFSGGQRQRIGIARALAIHPELIVCDEPLSALDIRTQRHIMELLQKLKITKNLTYVFISHDLHAVKNIADRVAVMYCGKVVEYGVSQQIFDCPAHDYTKALIAATPSWNHLVPAARKVLV